MKDNQELQIEQLLNKEAAKQSQDVPEQFHVGFLQILQQLPDRSGAGISQTPPAMRNKKSRKRIAAIVSAAALVLALGTGSYVSPTFAEWVKSFFTREELDGGLKTAAQHGFSQEMKAAVTDQGITFKVKEVLADANRLIFTYSLEKADGTMLEPTEIFEAETYRGFTDYYIKDRNNFYITDESGNLVSKSTTYGLLSGREVTQSVRDVLKHGDYADVTFNLKGPLKSKLIYLNVLLKKVHGVDGHWALKVPIDLQKSIASTKTIPLHASYTTPSGLNIALEEVSYAPTVTTFSLHSVWTEQAKQEMKKHPEMMLDEEFGIVGFHQLEYEVQDENGQVVATTRSDNPKSPNSRLIQLEDQDVRIASKGSELVLKESYAPLENRGGLTFRLIGIQQLERPNASWKLNLREASKKQPTFTYKDFQATVTGIQYGKEASIIEMEQTYSAMAGDLEWYNESGQLLEVKGIEVVPLGRADDKVRYKAKLKIPVKGLTESTRSITVKLPSIVTMDRNVDWQVPIPAKN
ncbi:MAG: DUF4179 domain-containing protein [Clostridia bacterium]